MSAERIEALLEEVEALPDARARETALELVQRLLDLYGDGLARIVGAVDLGPVADDEVVSHLLLLHGLHPVPLEQRVRAALEEVRPFLGTHGGDVEIAAIEDDVVRLRLQGSCSGCPSSTVTLSNAIEAAIYKAAPDVREIVAEDAPPPLIQLEVYETCPAPLHR
jgi:Fe-S cluster biogenesis protein NfuA